MEKILKIDLTSKKTEIEEVDKALLEGYIGGAGVGAAYFTENVPADENPFSEENALMISVGPFCGTIVPFCGRHFIFSKSPLTGLLGESSAGGFFGRELKRTGFDHLFITGISEKPVYISINNDQIEIKDASHLWGLTVSQTDDKIKEELKDDKLMISTIGPAGENLVRFASIMNEKERAAGRCGMGAVMGSKKLKAIVVKGNTKSKVKDKDKLKEASMKLREMIKGSAMAKVYEQFGTPVGMDSMSRYGDIPIRNYTESRWQGLRNIGFTAIEERGEIKHHACFGCPVGCTGMIEFDGKWVRWPEYETLAMMGSNLLVDDLDSLIKWNVLINDLGMDTISLGGVIALFLDALLIKDPRIDISEFKLYPDPDERIVMKKWGNTDIIEQLINLIAKREGIGDDLAEGVKRICEKYNLDEKYATHVKGLEVPAHEPRSNDLTALDYATTPRGAYHCYMPMHLSTSMNLKKDIGLKKKVARLYKPKQATIAVKKIQDAAESYVACGGCIFGFEFIDEIQPWVDCLNAIQGKEFTVESWMEIGAKLIDLKRKYSETAGVTKADDMLNKRFMTPIKQGGTRGSVPPLEDMLKQYYELRGW
jgi:aldehyde:ferredoxin oxidoreductase